MIKIKEEFKRLIPELTPEEFKQLETNCIDEGIREPIITWKGYIIDGHNRYHIAKKWDLEYETTEKYFEGEEDVKEWMIKNQFGRRNLSPYQRSVLALALEDIFKSKAKENLILSGKNFGIKKGFQNSGNPIEKINTHKELAKVANVSHDIVARVRKIQEAAPDEMKAKLEAGEISINKAYQEIKKQEKKEAKIKEFEELSMEFEESKDDSIVIKFEDFRTGCELIENNSIDAIITDPPYPAEFLPLWEDMFTIAERVLKPSGFMVCYANHQNLDEIFRLKNNLKYYWIFKLDFTKKPIAMGRNLIACWKPVLVYQKLPFKKIETTIEDQIKETKPFDYDERNMHDLNWGQSLGKFEWIIENFTKPNDLILEPFAGTGTTLVAAKNTKRRCIGFEIEQEKYEKIIKGRLNDGR